MIEIEQHEIQYLNSMGLLLVEVPTHFTKASRIRPHLPCWVTEGNFYKGDRLLRQFKYEQGMPGGKRRRPFTPVDTDPTSVKKMLLSLEMVD